MASETDELLAKLRRIRRLEEAEWRSKGIGQKPKDGRADVIVRFIDEQGQLGEEGGGAERTEAKVLREPQDERGGRKRLDEPSVRVQALREPQDDPSTRAQVLRGPQDERKVGRPKKRPGSEPVREPQGEPVREPQGERRQEANRQNALLSTGPRDTSLTRYNARKHGILSEHFFIDVDERASFEEMREALLDRVQPEGIVEEFLADKLLSVMWRWRRIIIYESDTILGVGRKHWEQYSDTVPEDRALTNIERYEGHLSRQFYKALGKLQELQAIRLGRREW